MLNKRDRRVNRRLADGDKKGEGEKGVTRRGLICQVLGGGGTLFFGGAD
jgi:hypothetical protein